MTKTPPIIYRPLKYYISCYYQQGRCKLRTISRAGPKVGGPTPTPKTWEDPTHPHEKRPKYLVPSHKIRKNGEYRDDKQKGTPFYVFKTPFRGRTQGQLKF